MRVRPSVLALPLAPLLVLPLLLGLAACDDGRKASEQDAVDELGKLEGVLKEDVAQVRRGLPEGAAKLGPLIDPDNLGTAQSAVARARAAVHDLSVAKSTFFSYADDKGVVVRSEADPDVLAGKSIVGPFPALQKALGPAGVLSEAYGDMRDLHLAKTGPDLILSLIHI